MNHPIQLPTPHGTLHGQIERPAGAHGLILAPRVAAGGTPLPGAATSEPGAVARLAARGFAVLGIGLISPQESHFPDAAHNVPRLASRLIDLLDLVRDDPTLVGLPLAILAGGDVTPAAIRAAAQRDLQVKALACHGGIADLAGLQSLKLLAAPTLMLFDANDPVGPAAWQRALPHLACPHETHRTAGPQDTADRAASWFALHLR